MRIFIVCNSLGAGGAERVGVNLANGFAHHGHEVQVNAIERSKFYSQDHIVRMWEEVIGKVVGKGA